MHQNTRFIVFYCLIFISSFSFALSTVSSSDMHWYFAAAVVVVVVGDGIADYDCGGIGVHFIPHYPSQYCQLNIIITITSLNSTRLLNLYYSFCLNSIVFVCAWHILCMKKKNRWKNLLALTPTACSLAFVPFVYSFSGIIFSHFLSLAVWNRIIVINIAISVL